MRKTFVYLGIIAAFFVIGLLLANFVIMPSLVRRGEEVMVPNVCNLPLETAIQELEKYGLEGIVTERRYDNIIEQGKVIIQEPLPDEKVKKGRIINLSVSLGSETVKIPYLTGIDFEKGKLIIQRLGLTVGEIDSVFSDSIANGKIVQTIPEFEADARKGSAIKLIVSKGRSLEMPNLVGMPLDEVKNLVKDMNLIIGEIKEVDASGTSGNVILQDPEPKKLVYAGDTINLMVVK